MESMPSPLPPSMPLASPHVPRSKPHHGAARDLFMYLLMFATLYTSAISVGNALFELINRAFPDALANNYYNTVYSNDSIRWALASVIIAFPIYVFVAWVLKKEMAQDSTLAHSKTRKWLTYLTLFIAAGVIIGDLIYVLYSLLGGELTVRFALKALSIFIIGGSIFGYYFFDIKKTP